MSNTQVESGYADKAGKGIHNQHNRRVIGDVLSYILLTVLGIIWLLPIVWVFLESFNQNSSSYQRTFFPTQYTFNNYKQLFTETNVMNFGSMFLRTFIIACFVCVISVAFVLFVAYCMSRMRFRFRKPFMNIVLVLGMFPSIMAVVAVYFILKAMNLTSGNWTVVALILVYSAGTGAGFYMMKGYMDTIPNSLDEAAMLDGCTRWQVFYKIILPICRPMIVYQAITGFLTPWLDFRISTPWLWVCGRCCRRSTSPSGTPASPPAQWSSPSRSPSCSWSCSVSTRSPCPALSRADAPNLGITKAATLIGAAAFAYLVHMRVHVCAYALHIPVREERPRVGWFWSFHEYNEQGWITALAYGDTRRQWPRCELRTAQQHNEITNTRKHTNTTNNRSARWLSIPWQWRRASRRNIMAMTWGRCCAAIPRCFPCGRPLPLLSQ